MLCVFASFSAGFSLPTRFSESLCNFVSTTLHTLLGIKIFTTTTLYKFRLNEDRLATSDLISAKLSVPRATIRGQLLRIGKRYLLNNWLPHALIPCNDEISRLCSSSEQKGVYLS